MKPNSKMLFGNIFDEKSITPNYLARFTDDLIAKLIKNNPDGELDELTDLLQQKIIPLRAELTEVDTSFNNQVGKTATLDEFISNFVAYMKNIYFIIATAMGGDKTPGFKEFYPKGKSEYIQITKTKMDTVTGRLKALATTYETQLSVETSTQLKGFQTQWSILRNTQLQQKSQVKTNRSERTTARHELEMALLETIRSISLKYLGDEQKCNLYFDFNLLFGVHHSSHHNGDSE